MARREFRFTSKGAAQFVCCAILALFAGMASAADTATRALLSGLIDKVDLRYCQQIFTLALADQRVHSAALLLGGMGQGAKLPDTWQRGNPHWEQAHTRLSRAIDAEEASGGPLFVITKADFVTVFNPPWNPEEIESLTRIASTDFGRTYLRFMDLMLVPIFVQQFANMKEISPPTAVKLRQIEAGLKSEFGPIALELQNMGNANATDAERLKALAGRLTQDEGRKIGEAIMKPSVARLLNAMYASMADILAIMEDFRKTSDNPANRL